MQRPGAAPLLPGRDPGLRRRRQDRKVGYRGLRPISGCVEEVLNTTQDSSTTEDSMSVDSKGSALAGITAGLLLVVAIIICGAFLGVDGKPDPSPSPDRTMIVVPQK